MDSQPRTVVLMEEAQTGCLARLRACRVYRVRGEASSLSARSPSILWTVLRWACPWLGSSKEGRGYYDHFGEPNLCSLFGERISSPTEGQMESKADEQLGPV